MEHEPFKSIIFAISGTSGIINSVGVSYNTVRSRIVQNKVSFYISFIEYCIVSVLNIQGKKVVEFETTPQNHWYPVGKSLSPGMYIIRISKADEVLNNRYLYMR